MFHHELSNILFVNGRDDHKREKGLRKKRNEEK
jgi:hypothetical protein